MAILEVPARSDVARRSIIRQQRIAETASRPRRLCAVRVSVTSEALKLARRRFAEHECGRDG